VLFSCGPCYDTVSILGSTASNYRTINEKGIGKDPKESCCNRILKSYPGKFLEGLGKKQEKSQDFLLSDRDFKLLPREHKYRVKQQYLLTNWTLRSLITACSIRRFMKTFKAKMCFAYSSVYKIQAKYSSETSVEFQLTTRCYIPEDRTFHNHFSENFKSCKSRSRRTHEMYTYIL
jgi:hypothetical protein